MAITWPIGLPQDLLQEGHTEKFANNVLRTSMESGPSKTRRRFTSAVRPVTGKMVMTVDETITLETFYNDTLFGGSLSFEWKIPRTGEMAVFRFTEPPELAPTSGVSWEVTLKLEIMP